MTNSFAQVMKTKTIDGLTEYVNRMDSFTPEAVEAAIAELIRRGKTFNSEELSTIDTWLNAKKADFAFQQPEADPVPVITMTEAKAPETLYSVTAIWCFTMFFSPIFGAFLLASNIKESKAKTNVYIFGFVYLVASALLIRLLPQNLLFNVAINIAGGLVLTQYFWKKYIGEQTEYTPRTVTRPLLIALAICFLFIALFVLTRQPL